MEKVGGEAFFLQKLGGSALIINALPPKFLQKCYDLMFHFLKSSRRSLLLEARFLA